MAKRVAGICYFRVDGIMYSLKGSLTISPADVTRESVVGLDRVHGYKESPLAPYISVQLTKTPEISLLSLTKVTDSTVTAECADGTVYTLRNAFHTGTSELDGGEGQVTVRFDGLEMKEILPT